MRSMWHVVIANAIIVHFKSGLQASALFLAKGKIKPLWIPRG